MYKLKKKLQEVSSPSGKKRRSSLQVNLSYTIDLSDSENIDGDNNNLSITMSQNLSQILANIDQKNEELNESTSRLREVILNKTREIFKIYDNDNMRQKTSSILQSQVSSKSQGLSPVLRSSNKCNIEKPENKSRKPSQIYYPKISRTQRSNNFQDESLILTTPIISSTFYDKHCSIHESCNKSQNSQSRKRSYRETSQKLNTTKKPQIRSIQPCRVELERFDGYPQTKSDTILQDVSMELTNIQGGCILNKTRQTSYKPGPKFTHERKKNYPVQKHINLQRMTEADSDPEPLNPSMRVNTSLDRDLSQENTGGAQSGVDSDSDSTVSRLERERDVSQSKTRNLPSKKTVGDESDIVEASPNLPKKSSQLRSQIHGNSTQNIKSRDVSSTSARRDQLLSQVNEHFKKTLVTVDVHREANSDEESPTSQINTNTKGRKKKLFTQHDSPGHFVSLSPALPVTPVVLEAKKKISRPRIRRNLAGEIIRTQAKSQAPSQPPPIPSQPPSSSECSQDVQKIPKKKRLIKSKKIVVKKKSSRNILSDSNDERDDSVHNRKSSQSKRKSSTFMEKKTIARKRSFDRRIIIVATGLCNGDKETIKKAVKQLGGATVEAVVSRKTTHVVTTGGRTINLLRGIIRGCWIVNFDWILKSMEADQWLSTENFEIENFSKAVRENRRDREMFGRSYVPDLFTTCDLVYIEKHTNPPQNMLKELFKTAGGRIIEDAKKAKIIVGPSGIRENWILDSIAHGELQPIDQYSR